MFTIAVDIVTIAGDIATITANKSRTVTDIDTIAVDIYILKSETRISQSKN
jgi:hypothetical protein